MITCLRMAGDPSCLLNPEATPWLNRQHVSSFDIENSSAGKTTTNEEG